MRNILRVVQTILAELDCPRSLTVKILLDAEDWVALVNLRVSVTDYADADSLRRASQATELLRKADFLPTGLDLEGEAVSAFFEAEKLCYRTNEKLHQFVFQPPRLNGLAGPERLLSLARKNVADWLGRFDDLRVTELARHGPGSTYNDRGGSVTPADKMSTSPTLTDGALGWLIPFSSTSWATALLGDESHASRPPTFIPGNRFTTVPKDSSKNRGICIEPSINVFYQLGLGKLVRARLKRNTGIDLQYAQEVHRADARAGSFSGELATIDLSSASDTVCKNLVKILLPPDWYEAFASLRSPKTLLKGKWYCLEKFSSMGNGYTFELESVIFLALAVAVAQHLELPYLPGVDIRVYGDDIIVPSRIASEVLVVLGFCGFKPNGKKTFISGSFRESCGGDFFLGEDVRPLYITENPTEPFQWLVLANRVRSWFGENLSWKRCVDNLPTAWRQVTGPDHLGDVCLHTSDRDKWPRRQKDWIHYNRAWIPIQDWKPWNQYRPNVILASALLMLGDGVRGITYRDNVTGYRRGWVADS